MKLYKVFSSVYTDKVHFTTKLNKWITANYEKYNYKIVTPLEDNTGVYGVMIAYWPKHESHTVWYVWNQNCIKDRQSPIVFMSHSHKKARQEADNLNLLTTSEASIYHVSRNLLIK